MKEVLPYLWTALATGGFAIRYGLRAKDLAPTAAGAVLGWLVYSLVSKAGAPAGVVNAAQGYFVASLAIGIFAEVVAVLLKKPATIYVVTGIFPLVPGGGMYYTMLHSVRGEAWTAMFSGYETLSAAGAIAAGLAVSSALSRLLSLRSIARRIATHPERLPRFGAPRTDARERENFEAEN